MYRKFVRLVFDNSEPGGAGSAPAAGEPPAVAPAGEPPAVPPVDDEQVVNADGTPKTVPLAAQIAERKKRQDAEKREREAREELAYYKGRADAVPVAPVVAPAEPAAPKAPVAPVKPKAIDFDDNYDEYEQALNDYETKREDYLIARTKFEVANDQQTQQQQHRVQQNQQQIVSTFKERLATEAALDPDIVNLANTFHLQGPNHIPLTSAMQEAMLESEVGPKILRYFSNNKAEAVRLANMSPSSQIREIGKIEAKLTTTTKPDIKHVTTAPEPITPLGSGGDANADEDKMPMSDYLARERAKLIAKRQRS